MEQIMLICAKVRELLQSKKIGKATPSPDEAHKWMTTEGRVNWGMLRAPTVKNVTALLKCAEVLSQSPEACSIVDRARAQ